MPRSHTPAPWQQDDECQPFQARVLAAMDRHADTLLAHYPTLPVPESGIRSLVYSTGPFTSSALLTLWRDLPEWFTGECSECTGPIRGYLVGGLLASGGVIGRCLHCATRHRRSTGNGARAIALVPEAVRASTYPTGWLATLPGNDPPLDVLTLVDVTYISADAWTPAHQARQRDCARLAWQPLLAVLGELGERIVMEG